MGKRAIFWFRRDLRLADNPALLAAIDEADDVIPLFIMDDEIAERSGAHRRSYLAASLHALNESLNGSLFVKSGSPAEVIADLMKRYKAESVHSAFPFALPPLSIQFDISPFLLPLPNFANFCLPLQSIAFLIC